MVFAMRYDENQQLQGEIGGGSGVSVSGSLASLGKYVARILFSISLTGSSTPGNLSGGYHG